MSKHSNGSPVAYAAFSPNGNIRIWVTDQDEAKKIGDRIGIPGGGMADAMLKAREEE